MILCFITLSCDPARKCNCFWEDVKSGQIHMETGLPKGWVLGSAKDPGELQGQLESQDPGSPATWSEPENRGFGSLWWLKRPSVPNAAGWEQHCLLLCCMPFHQVFGSAFNTSFQEIHQERANIWVIYRPSYGLPYYCLWSMRVGIYVVLRPFLPTERTDPQTFQCTLSWEERNKERIPKDPQRKKHLSLSKRSTGSIHNWQRKRFCRFLASFVMGVNQKRIVFNLSSGW